MENRSLVVSISPAPPYLILDSKNGSIILRGFLGEIWRILESKLGFTSRYEIEDFEEGAKKMRLGERDAILRPVVITPEDVTTYDFTVPLIRSWYHIYVKDSDEVNTSYSYIRNWSTSLWISTVLVILMFTVFLYCMLQVSSRYVTKRSVDVPTHTYHYRITHLYLSDTKEVDTVLEKEWRRENKRIQLQRIRNEESLANCLMSAIANFCSQGSYIHSHITSVRILVLSFLIFGMIMSNSYSALLVSQLTLRERYLPFSTLEELANQHTSVSGGGYVMCVREESYPHVTFRINQTSSVLQKKWERFVNHKPCTSLAGGFEYPPEVMCASFVAILESPAVMRSSIQRNTRCHMMHLKEQYWSVDISVLILHDLQHRDKRQINKQIVWLRETGIISHLENKWVRRDEVISPAADPTVQVSLGHISGVLFLFSGCVFFSLFVLLVEYIVHFYNHFRA